MNRKDWLIILALFTDVMVALSFEAYGNGRLFQDFIDLSRPIGVVFYLVNWYLGVVTIISIYQSRDKIRKFMGVQ
jgi:hypothetical protein